MRLTRRHGSLRAVGTHPSARLLAALALALNLLVHLSPLWVPAVERGGIEVCTAYGLTVIPDRTAPPGGSQDRQQRLKACPFCAVHAAVMLVPAAASLPGNDAPTVALQPSRRDAVYAALAAGFDHLSRAPPHLA